MPDLLHVFGVFLLLGVFVSVLVMMIFTFLDP